MAITYPLSFPDWLRGMTKSDFDIPMQVEVAPIGGGDIARDLGPSLWKADYRTVLLGYDEVERFRMWIKLLRNGVESFWGYNFRRPYTESYPNGFAGLTRAGGGAFTGAITITTINSDNKTMTLGGFPAGFVINPGDGIAFDYSSTIRAYHQFAEPATATSLGAIAAVEVVPHVRPGWTEGQAANIDVPKAKMRLVPDSASFDGQPRGPGYWSFQATQTLMP